MNKFLEILLGLVLLIVPIVAVIQYEAWGIATVQFLMGAVVVGIVLLGLLFIILGISDLRA